MAKVVRYKALKRVVANAKIETEGTGGRVHVVDSAYM
jgi:hypothetical protein